MQKHRVVESWFDKVLNWIKEALGNGSEHGINYYGARDCFTCSPLKV